MRPCFSSITAHLTNTRLAPSCAGCSTAKKWPAILD
jgi:hypothetical protein